uniref:RanBP2-type domain-containing protein n=1 Tax=Chromera velia CCMP2878 TaxID=1169474 RepID=A0A0G4H0A4_9ALVE|eukprot:Cvel_5494.t1-p1 / transcript=Cvel_5494.t1 / gene=Cvel_5494 / organism=Chromera_velia_CCMP2878 / gene_product=hypothetical protein / transcript_product=hypothetical protein / location=Cvel_scaffold257:31258-32481(-) / protein_length=408 / sequence_SO=supercontig / SO=protein_coding / is_pseudo=false
MVWAVEVRGHRSFGTSPLSLQRGVPFFFSPLGAEKSPAPSLIPRQPRRNFSLTPPPHWSMEKKYFCKRTVASMRAEDPIRKLVEHMKVLRDRFLKGDTDPFWWHKSGQRVLAVLMLKQTKADGQTELSFVKGVNVEVSLPTGTNCAERAAFNNAVTDRPDLKREEFLAVAVLALRRESDHEKGGAGAGDGNSEDSTLALSTLTTASEADEDINPLFPCGVCQEWIRKIQKESPDFKVIAFDSVDCQAIIEAYPRVYHEELAGVPPDMVNEWRCKVCGHMNAPVAATCFMCGSEVTPLFPPLKSKIRDLGVKRKKRIRWRMLQIIAEMGKKREWVSEAALRAHPLIAAQPEGAKFNLDGMLLGILRSMGQALGYLEEKSAGGERLFRLTEQGRAFLESSSERYWLTDTR